MRAYDNDKAGIQVLAIPVAFSDDIQIHHETGERKRYWHLLTREDVGKHLNGII